MARSRVKPENRAKLQEIFQRQGSRRTIPGMVAAYTLYEDEGDTAWLFAVFQDRTAYDKNADDPAQDADYREYRALMEDEPEWHDGEIAGM